MLNTACQLKTSRGTSPEKSWMPRRASEDTAAPEMAAGCAFESSTPPMKPPTTVPSMKTRFHSPTRFQSYLKKSARRGRQAAQRCRRLLVMPNGLLPMRSRLTATSPTRGPVTYHGHGRCKNSSIRWNPPRVPNASFELDGAVHTNLRAQPGRTEARRHGFSVGERESWEPRDRCGCRHHNLMDYR